MRVFTSIFEVRGFGSAKNLRCEFEELPRGKIFFTNLDPFDAGG